MLYIPLFLSVLLLTRESLRKSALRLNIGKHFTDKDTCKPSKPSTNNGNVDSPPIYSDVQILTTLSLIGVCVTMITTLVLYVIYGQTQYLTMYSLVGMLRNKL